MRRIAVFALLSTSLAACGGSDRGGRGYVVVVARDANMNPNEGRDAEESAGDANQTGGTDAGLPGDANDPQPGDAQNFPDAWSPPDAGFEDAETFPDAWSPPDAGRIDAGRPDGGRPDMGFPDLGIPFPPADAGRPDTGLSDSGTPPAYQTTVSLVAPSLSQVTLDLIPPVDADPLTYSVELSYDNVGPGSQNISITNVNVVALIFPLQDFQAGPAHNAPVGITTHTVSKIAGTGQALSAPETYCGLPAIILLEFSNGQQIQDIGLVNCIQ
jgi:hypothetical protein